MKACIKDQTEIVKFLIDKFPNVIKQRDDENGLTGFLYAC